MNMRDVVAGWTKITICELSFLEKENINDETTLEEIDADALMEDIQAEYDIYISTEDVKGCKNFKELVDLILSRGIEGHNA